MPGYEFAMDFFTNCKQKEEYHPLAHRDKKKQKKKTPKQEVRLQKIYFHRTPCKCTKKYLGQLAKNLSIFNLLIFAKLLKF